MLIVLRGQFSLSLASAVTYADLRYSLGFPIQVPCHNRRFSVATNHSELFSLSSTAILPDGISKKAVKCGTGSPIRVGNFVGVILLQDEQIFLPHSSLH
jgi:hypothetical protein